ncbi:hypothetical protein P7K49_025889 [Saguinus oedipus]|uniref:F5/8 type C domain-containing protein n=1 Tax=Saguinus oedipus TaxID=9490 RepID=A0ABQ9UJD3_SAGOE|nr:hypothetical protein P7K49_025889 [Saguinus oedipus]
MSLQAAGTLCLPLLQPLSLPHPDPCYSPLELARLAKGSLHASSEQLEHPTWAVLLGAPTQGPSPQGWRPGEDAYAKWHTQPHFLQLDLLRPRNLTGIIVPETGSSKAYATSFSLQFSSSGLHWHDYHDILPGILPLPKALSPRAFQSPQGHFLHLMLVECSVEPRLGSQCHMDAGNRPSGSDSGRLLPRNWDNLDPTVWTFGQMVEARFVRVRPHDDHHSNVPLRVELLGCEPGGLCNGVLDCEDGSDEEGCVLPSEGTSRYAVLSCAAHTLGLAFQGTAMWEGPGTAFTPRCPDPVCRGATVRRLRGPVLPGFCDSLPFS